MAGPYLGLHHKMGSMTPLTATLPFNRDCIGQTFEPAKRGGAQPDRRGHWLIVQDQGLVVSNDNHEPALPFGDAPAGFEVAAKQALLLGTWRGEPCWVVAVARGDTLPAGYHRETCVPMQGTKLPDDLLSLGGMAMQALWWESTSGHCPRCGEATTRICTPASSCSCVTASACCWRASQSGRPGGMPSSPASSTTASRWKAPS